jgi:hypothetical protein
MRVPASLRRGARAMYDDLTASRRHGGGPTASIRLLAHLLAGLT